MARELRFRQWINNEFHYWGFNMEDGSSFTSPARTGANNWAESQQFTGLKDKNGKEIYEGDILKWGHNIDTMGDGLGVIPDGDFIEENITVIFESGEFVADDMNLGLLVESEDWVEIIGNIYENPDLLK